MASSLGGAGLADRSASRSLRRLAFAPAAAGSCKLPKWQRGFIISAEAMLFATILVLGTIGGWMAVRSAANAELVDFANALSRNVPYFSDPNRGKTGTTVPLEYSLEPCFLDEDGTLSEGSQQCIALD